MLPACVLQLMEGPGQEESNVGQVVIKLINVSNRSQTVNILQKEFKVGASCMLG